MRYLVTALILLAASGAMLAQLAADDTAVPPLRVFAAAGLRAAVEPAAVAYERETGQPVEVHWGGTGSLYGQIAAGASCDVFLPGDRWTAERGEAAGLLAIAGNVGSQRPVLAVAPGNPKGIAAFNDLLRGDVAVSMADPDQAATGRAAREAVGPEQWQALRAKVKVLKPTVSDSATDVVVGAADAAFVWDHLVTGPSRWAGLERADLNDVRFEREPIVTALVRGRRVEAAEAFVEWLSEPTRGRRFFDAALP